MLSGIFSDDDYARNRILIAAATHDLRRRADNEEKEHSSTAGLWTKEQTATRGFSCANITTKRDQVN